MNLHFSSILWFYDDIFIALSHSAHPVKYAHSFLVLDVLSVLTRFMWSIYPYGGGGWGVFQRWWSPSTVWACLQWQVNLMGALTFLYFFFHIFFLKLIMALDCVLSMWEKTMIPMYRLIITQLIWTTWTSLSTVWERPLNLLVHLTFLQNSIFILKLSDCLINLFVFSFTSWNAEMPTITHFA